MTKRSPHTHRTPDVAREAEAARAIVAEIERLGQRTFDEVEDAVFAGAERERIDAEHDGDDAGDDGWSSLPPVPAFPLTVFPERVAAWMTAAAVSIGCPPDFIALPLLALAEGTMGKTQRIVIRPGFAVLPGSWYAVVGESGTGKSPGQKVAQEIVQPFQDAAWQTYRDAMAAWQSTPKDHRGAQPTPTDFFVTDATTESMWAALAATPGLTRVEDELRRLLKSLDSYRVAGDRQNLLSLWSNSPIRIARKTSEPIYLPRPCASIVGGVQPALLPTLRGDGPDASLDDGWLPRFLFAWPDAEPLPLSHVAFDAKTGEAVVTTFGHLRRETAVDVTLTHGAYEVFSCWHEQNRQRQIATTGVERQWSAKAPIHLARLTLALHRLWWPDDDERQVSAETMRGGITLVRYFQRHLDRVLPVIGAEAASAFRDRLLKRLTLAAARDDGWLTRSDLLRSLTCRRIQLDAGLQELWLAGVVERETVPGPTKPTERWRLRRDNADSSDNTDTAILQNARHAASPRRGDTLWDAGNVAAPRRFPTDCGSPEVCAVHGPCERYRATKRCQPDDNAEPPEPP